MQEELKLAMKPKRDKADQDAARAEKRAYDRAYRETKKEMGKAEGAAAGVAAAMSDSAGAAPIGALERARARAPSVKVLQRLHRRGRHHQPSQR